MGLIFLIIVGAAAGFIATRIMDLETSVPITIGIGIAGALLGTLILRLALAVTGMAFGFIGAVIGAMVLIWLWKKLGER